MDRLKVAFFTEAGTKRGMGHLVRSFTISQEFKKHQHTVFFNLVSDIKYNCKFKNINYITWENFKLTEIYDIVFIDSYEANKEVYEILCKNSKLAVYIDDYARLSYPEGVVINFAPEAKEYFNIVNDKFLLGIKYVPIRKNLIKIKKKGQEAIFIMLGGSDTQELSLSVLKALNKTKIKKYIVINKKKDVIKAKRYENCSILYKPTDNELFDAMSKSCIAITTASMSVYELAYLKIPTIVLTVAKNQQIGVQQLIKFKLAQHHIDILKKNWQYKLAYSIKKIKKTNSLVDKKGSERIYQKVVKVFYAQ